MMVSSDKLIGSASAAVEGQDLNAAACCLCLARYD